MPFQDLGDGFHRVGGTSRSALTGRYVTPVEARPVLIVAATIADGESTASQIGVDHFTVITPRSHAQVGRIVRGVVMTPSFAALLESNDRAASVTARCARRDASKSGVGRV
jgi:hypothetical protein